MKKEDYFIAELEEQFSDSENMKLFREMKNGKDNRELIILHNLNLIKAVVDAYDSNCDKEELFQVGILELINCVDKFDCEKFKSFPKYATRNIKQKIAKFLSNLPNDEMIINYGYISSVDDNDMIDNEYITDFEINIEEDYEKKELATQVRNYVDSLPQPVSECIKLHFGFYGKQYTLEEIGRIYNVSRVSIRRTIAKELMAIRRLISTRKLYELKKQFKKGNK